MNPELKMDHNNEHLRLGKIKLSKVISVKETARKEKVYDLKVMNNENYVIENLGLVHNGGKRAGAGTIALPIWHNDILDFLDMQTEHGDLRMKAYDVFPQVTIPDIFMERDRNKQPWITFSPFEVKKKLGIDVRGLYGPAFTEAYLKIEQAFSDGKLKIARKMDNARDLMKIILRIQFETGLPYIAFTDTINEYNPNKGDTADDGSVNNVGITSVNLCTESFSNVMPDKFGHVCNLASIVLGNIKNMAELGKISSLTCRILDYGISLTNAPDKITADHNNRYRTIGIGLQGLHDHLAHEWMNFRDLDYIREIAECVEYHAAMESTRLASRFGPFEAFGKSEWKNGNRVAQFAKHASGNYDWAKLQSEIDMFGIRNSQLTSPAPNCHSLEDEVMTIAGKTTIRKLFEVNGYNIEELTSLPPHWVELKMPVEVPVPGGDTEFVERIWWNGIQETIDIEFEDGVIYSFTPNHMLLVKTPMGNSWVEVKDITTDMVIVDINDK